MANSPGEDMRIFFFEIGDPSDMKEFLELLPDAPFFLCLLFFLVDFLLRHISPLHSLQTTDAILLPSCIGFLNLFLQIRQIIFFGAFGKFAALDRFMVSPSFHVVSIICQVADVLLKLQLETS